MSPNGNKTRKQEQPKRAQESSSASSLAAVGSSAALLDLQRTAGNQTVRAWLQSAPPLIQTKSSNGGSQDAAERQADVLNEALKEKGVAVVYHTFEEKEHRPSDIKAGDPRRNYVTPLDTNKPEAFAPPDPDFAPSYTIGPNAPYIHVFQFGFLIDRNGEVHIRPGDVREFSTFTGKPEGK